MKISSETGLYGISGTFHVHFRGQRLASRPQSDQTQSSVNREEFMRIQRHVVELRKSLEKIDPLRFRSRIWGTEAGTASVTSSSEIGDLATKTPAVMNSTEEVNTALTSISTFAPELIGSTGQASISGVYDGSNGTGTLTFEVDNGGTHGQDDIKIKVYDPNEEEIDQIDIKKKHPIDQEYTLSNGLIFKLGEGDLVKHDSFTLDVNDAVPTSFSPALPGWIGSTALVSLDGVYDGSNGTGTLLFEVDNGGTHGQDDIKIKVYDPNEDKIDEIEIKKEHPIDQEYTLSNGVIFTLGEGNLIKHDMFTLDVYDSVGSTVDPNKPFNGTGIDNPNLEYGISINDGSFQLNGVAIDVYVDDTINTVLDRITQSDANVSATYNAGTETVILTQKTAGSLPTIVLENDTSGFLEAMKLAGATPTPGTDGEPEKPLAEVETFSAIQSGIININGHAISIDVNVDSLNDVLARINASEAAVTASLNYTAQRVTLAADDPNQELVLDSGQTEFFSALEISDGTYHPTQASVGRKGMSEIYAYQVADVFQDVADNMKALFEAPEAGAPSNAFLVSLKQDTKKAISESFESEASHFKTNFGLDFDFRKMSKRIFDFSDKERSRLLSALTHKRQFREIKNLFFGPSPLKVDGLVERLRDTLKQAESDLEIKLGSATGLFLDAWA